MNIVKIKFFEGSNQYKVVETPLAPLNNMIAGTINELKHATNFRKSEDGYWAEIMDLTINDFVCRVKDDGSVGFIEDGKLEWFYPNLVDKDYTLIQIINL